MGITKIKSPRTIDNCQQVEENISHRRGMDGWAGEIMDGRCQKNNSSQILYGNLEAFNI